MGAAAPLPRLRKTLRRLTWRARGASARSRGVGPETGIHAGAAGEGHGLGGGREPWLTVQEHGTKSGGQRLDTGGHIPQQDRQVTRQAGDEAGGRRGSRGKEEVCGE